MSSRPHVVDRADLRERTRVFRDRPHAGEVVAELLPHEGLAEGLVLAVPAGGVPVAAVVARRLGLALDLAVVSKVTPPWNAEMGYGAVAFDGTVRLDRGFVRTMGLDEDEVREGIERAREKVCRRVERLRHGRPLPDLSRGPVILADDGLASGFTLRVAVEAVKRAGARSIVVAVPTAHRDSAFALAQEVDAVHCPNLRTGRSFAVADAYEWWSDLSDEDVLRVLEEAGRRG